MAQKKPSPISECLSGTILVVAHKLNCRAVVAIINRLRKRAKLNFDLSHIIGRRDRESSPFFDPPYDSPIEDELAYNAVKYLASDSTFVPQYEVQTVAGTFYLDFLVFRGDVRIGIECDGKEFHRDRTKDKARDTFILGSKSVDTIFRLRGNNIAFNVADCLYVISRFCPEVFSDRGRKNLESLADPATRAAMVECSKPFVLVNTAEFYASYDEPALDDYRHWTLSLDANSLKKNDYYTYKFRDYWEIFLLQGVSTMPQARKLLNDTIALIDSYYAELGKLTYDEYQALQNRIEELQNCAYLHQKT